ncbi:unnamed protein product [Camellia sinensis]
MEVARMAASATAEIQQVGKTSKTYSMKGKEIASRKGKTRPPLNFLSILQNAKKTIDTSCSDKLCKQLYTGVFLEDKKLYYVDEKTNKNYFMLFARKLDICWSNHSDYWKWTNEETSINKNVVKFKTKPLEHVELMLRVYEGATTTGNFAWTPGADFDPVATDDVPSFMDVEDYEDSSGLPPFQPVANSEHTVEGCDASMEQTPTGRPTK